jgi:predicted ATPase
LFVEQPEIHLHPKAQATVADLLFETSHARQVVVETHSVRFINRARIRVASGEVPAEHLMILYVDRTSNGSHITPIPVMSNGEFGATWPNGFFDERYEDTMALLKLRSKR